MQRLNKFQLPFGIEKNDYNITVYVLCYDAYFSSARIALSVQVKPQNKKTAQVRVKHVRAQWASEHFQ